MEKEMHRAIGLADLCELMKAAWCFPQEDLATALSDGSFLSDVLSCFRDADADENRLNRADETLRAFIDTPAPTLLDHLRKGFSILYLSPGCTNPIWAYEAAFRFVASNREGQPMLFGSPISTDVEACMREAGVLPSDRETEPIDSVWNEFSFLSFAFGSLSASLYDGRQDDAEFWKQRIATFWDKHASRWLFDFMEKTKAEAPKHSYGAEYALLSELGVLVLETIREGRAQLSA